MSDNVWFVFKTLIKIPVYTAIVYIIFNCFMFGGAYFKMLGASHAIEMMVLEDNFISDSNLDILREDNGFLSSLITRITPRLYVVDVKESDFVEANPYDSGYILDANLSAEDADGVDVGIEGTRIDGVATRRTQFGEMRVCGIVWEYHWIMPLLPSEQTNRFIEFNNTTNQAVGGWDNFNRTPGTDSPISTVDAGTLANRREEKADLGTFEIRFLYKVPGLKYYADMDNP